mmetsp:Transcript_29471/g.84360  ORF Transcript_29471/g.84360 Transcript_29471/m.84360 type:complete len:223 (-) Transcript_29471:466-1134(-)
MSCFGREGSSASPASLSISLMVSPVVSTSLRVSTPVSTSLMLSRLLIVSSVSEAVSLRPVNSVSDAPLIPVKEAEDEEASERYLARFSSSPGGLGRVQTGSAGESVAWTLIDWTGFFSPVKYFVMFLMTAAAFATSCSSGMLQRPNFAPALTPSGRRSGVPRIAMRMCFVGSFSPSFTTIGCFSFCWKKILPRVLRSWVATVLSATKRSKESARAFFSSTVL